MIRHGRIEEGDPGTVTFKLSWDKYSELAIWLMTEEQHYTVRYPVLGEYHVTLTEEYAKVATEKFKL